MSTFCFFENVSHSQLIRPFLSMVYSGGVRFSTVSPFKNIVRCCIFVFKFLDLLCFNSLFFQKHQFYYSKSIVFGDGGRWFSMRFSRGRFVSHVLPFKNAVRYCMFVFDSLHFRFKIHGFLFVDVLFFQKHQFYYSKTIIFEDGAFRHLY